MKSPTVLFSTTLTHTITYTQQEVKDALFNLTLLGPGAAQTLLTGPYITRKFILGKPL